MLVVTSSTGIWGQQFRPAQSIPFASLPLHCPTLPEGLKLVLVYSWFGFQMVKLTPKK